MNAKRQLVPDYIQKLQVYKAGKSIDSLAREKGLTRISKLASNENPLGPSPLAVKEMTNGLWNTRRYPDMQGFALKSEIARLYNLELNNIVLGSGSEGIMGFIARAMIQTGDEVLTSEGSFIGFTILARSAGAKLVRTPLSQNYGFDIQAMIERISEATKIIYLANPNNPTGTYFTKSEFEELMSHVPEHVIVIMDEAYFEYAEHVTDFPDSMSYRFDNVITLRTLSKSYGLGGIRVGYGLGHAWLISNLHKVKLPFEPNLIAQLGAIGALKDRSHLERTLENNSQQYKRTFSFLTNNGLNPIPSLTNFIAFPTPSEKAAHWIFEHLLERGVIIRPLSSNEMGQFLRVSLGTEDEMSHFFEAMEQILPQYHDLFNAQQKGAM